MKKAKYFITCHELGASNLQPTLGINELRPERLRPLLVSKAEQKLAAREAQLSLEFDPPALLKGESNSPETWNFQGSGYMEKVVSLRVEKNILIMSTEMMSNMLAEYFKTKPVLKAWLFGSFARGEETSQSDVDILIVLDHSQTVGMDFFGMYEELKELLGRNVDLVTERSLAPFARKSVEQDRKLVYERTA